MLDQSIPYHLNITKQISIIFVISFSLQNKNTFRNTICDQVYLILSCPYVPQHRKVLWCRRTPKEGTIGFWLYNPSPSEKYSRLLSLQAELRVHNLIPPGYPSLWRIRSQRGEAIKYSKWEDTGHTLDNEIKWYPYNPVPRRHRPPPHHTAATQSVSALWIEGV